MPLIYSKYIATKNFQKGIGVPMSTRLHHHTTTTTNNKNNLSACWLTVFTTLARTKLHLSTQVF